MGERGIDRRRRDLFVQPALRDHVLQQGGMIFKLPGFVKLTNTEPFAAWFVVNGDATPDVVTGNVTLDIAS